MITGYNYTLWEQHIAEKDLELLALNYELLFLTGICTRQITPLKLSKRYSFQELCCLFTFTDISSELSILKEYLKKYSTQKTEYKNDNAV